MKPEINKMKINLLQKLRGSLFFKVSLLFSLSLVITIAVLMTIHRFLLLPGNFPVMHKNAVNYAGYIMNEIGDPQDIQKAQKIAGSFYLHIRIETPTQKWASHEDMIYFEHLKLPVHDEAKGIFAGFTDDGLTVAIHRDNHHYLFIMHPRKEGFRYIVGVFVLTIITFATILIVAMYFIMRWLLKPIKVLREGVRQLSEGNIEHEMSIRDFGSGIPEQDLPHIFEPFYRVDKSRSKKTGGYGLGMSLGKKIMEAHGGTIEITSRVKVGTTVFLKFKKQNNL